MVGYWRHQYIDDIDFAFADSVLYLNNGKRRHAGIFSRMRLDIGIPSHIYYWGNDTHRICACAEKNKERQKKIKQSKRVQRKDQEDNHKLGEGSVYNSRAGFDQFLGKFN